MSNYNYDISDNDDDADKTMEIIDESEQRIDEEDEQQQQSTPRIPQRDIGGRFISSSRATKKSHIPQRDKVGRFISSSSNAAILDTIDSPPQSTQPLPLTQQNILTPQLQADDDDDNDADKTMEINEKSQQRFDEEEEEQQQQQTTPHIPQRDKGGRFISRKKAAAKRYQPVPPIQQNILTPLQAVTSEESQQRFDDEEEEEEQQQQQTTPHILQRDKVGRFISSSSNAAILDIIDSPPQSTQPLPPTQLNVSTRPSPLVDTFDRVLNTRSQVYVTPPSATETTPNEQAALRMRIMYDRLRDENTIRERQNTVRQKAIADETVDDPDVSTMEELQDEVKYLLATSLIADFRKYCAHSAAAEPLQRIEKNLTGQLVEILAAHHSTRNSYISRLSAWIQLEQEYEEHDRNGIAYDMSRRRDYENRRKTYLNAVLSDEKKLYEVQYRLIEEAIKWKAADDISGHWTRWIQPYVTSLAAEESIKLPRHQLAPFLVLVRTLATNEELDSLQTLVTGEYGRLRLALLKQVNAQLVGWKKRNPAHNALLQLGRLRFHLRPKEAEAIPDRLEQCDENMAIYLPIGEIFETDVYNLFIQKGNRIEITGDNEDSFDDNVVDDDAYDKDELKRLIKGIDANNEQNILANYEECLRQLATITSDDRSDQKEEQLQQNTAFNNNENFGSYDYRYDQGWCPAGAEDEEMGVVDPRLAGFPTLSGLTEATEAVATEEEGNDDDDDDEELARRLEQELGLGEAERNQDDADGNNEEEETEEVDYLTGQLMRLQAIYRAGNAGQEEEEEDDDDDEEKKKKKKLKFGEVAAAELAKLRAEDMRNIFEIQNGDMQPLRDDTHRELAIRATAYAVFGDDIAEEVLAAGNEAPELLSVVTHIRPCTDRCLCSRRWEELKKEAVYGRQQLLSFLTFKSATKATRESFYKLYRSRPVQLQKRPFINWVRDHRRCFQGLRTIECRLNEIARLFIYLEYMERARSSVDWNAVRHLLSYEELPKRLLLRHSYQFQSSITYSREDYHHRQRAVERQWTSYIEAFENAMGELPHVPCQICDRFTAPQQMQFTAEGTALARKIARFVVERRKRPAFNRFDIEMILRYDRIHDDLDDMLATRQNDADNNREQPHCEEDPKAEKDHWGACARCLRTVYKGRMPNYALMNCLDYPEIPAVFNELNWIEKIMIQPLKAVMKIGVLHSLTGHPTGMRGTSGPMVMVPVSVKDTMDHVAESLPNVNRLKLYVRSDFQLVVVRMDLVLQALRYLVDNHRLMANIEINEAFQFQVGQDVFFERQISDAEANANLIRRRMNLDGDGHVLTQDPNRFLTAAAGQPQQMIFADMQTRETEAELTAAYRYTLNRTRGEIISIDSKDTDVLIFPFLHPTGQFGMTDPARPITLKMWSYIRCRLNQANRMWAQNPNWCLFAYQLYNQKAITGMLGTQARIRQGTTGVELVENMKDPDWLTRNITSIFGSLKNSPYYWQAARLNLRCHIQYFGPPTWFITLNPNITGWSSLHRYYERCLRLPEGTVNRRNIRKYVENDAAIVARYWECRINAVIRKFWMIHQGPTRIPLSLEEEAQRGPGSQFLFTTSSPDNRPLSAVHIYARNEYQAKGYPHTHLALWSSDAPSANASADELRDYLDKHVTARLPNKNFEPLLHKLVTENQMHWKKHTKTCLRRKHYNGQWISYCRFNFPRLCTNRTLVFLDGDGSNNNENDEARVQYAQLCRIIPALRQRPYHLARRSNETMINDYCPALMRIFKSNMDIQCLLLNKDVRQAVNYMTVYMNKDAAEREHFFGGNNDNEENENDMTAEDAAAPPRTNNDNVTEEDLAAAIQDVTGKPDEMREIDSLQKPTGGGRGRGSMLCRKLFGEMLKTLNMRHVGMVEAMAISMGLWSHLFDSDHLFIDLGLPELRRRILKKMTDALHQVAEPAKRPSLAYCDNMIDTYYPKRPIILESNSLFNVATYFHVTLKVRLNRPSSIYDDDQNETDEEEELENTTTPATTPLRNERSSQSSRRSGGGEISRSQSRSSTRRGMGGGNMSDVDDDPDAVRQPTNAHPSWQSRNPFEGHYWINELQSPFYEHPHISIGTVMPFDSDIAPELRHKVYRKRKGNLIRVFLPECMETEFAPIDVSRNLLNGQEKKLEAELARLKQLQQQEEKEEVNEDEEEVQDENIQRLISEKEALIEKKRVLRDDFFRRLCLLFIPWRAPESDFIVNYERRQQLNDQLPVGQHLTSYEECFTHFLSILDDETAGGCPYAARDLRKWLESYCAQKYTDIQSSAFYKQLVEARRQAAFDVSHRAPGPGAAKLAVVVRKHRMPGHVAALQDERGPFIADDPELDEFRDEEYVRIVDEIKLQQDLAALKQNAIQQRIFEMIRNRVAEQALLKQQRLDELARARGRGAAASGNRQQPNILQQLAPPVSPDAHEALRIFVSGLAGTGKSFLIQVLADYLTNKYCRDMILPEQRVAGLLTDDDFLLPEQRRQAVARQQRIRPAVLLAASTGLAAVNIGGKTIHTLLAIPSRPRYVQLSAQLIQKKRALFSNVRLLIIDEISMCSSILLYQTNLHLQQILGNLEPFGGLNIVVMGDLLQLPPIRATHVFRHPKPEEINRWSFGGQGGANVRFFENRLPTLGAIGLWRIFSYFELTQNMRQQEDQHFAAALYRLRIGQLTPEDIRLFESRLIPSEAGPGIPPTFKECVAYFTALRDRDDRAMAVFATVAEAAQMNEAMMDFLNEEVVDIPATDRLAKEYNPGTRRLVGIIYGAKAIDLAAEEEQARQRNEKPWQQKAYAIESLDEEEERSRKKKPHAHPTSVTGVPLPDEEEGLLLNLKLCRGCRVFLRMNIPNAPIPGLVNGATGVLVDFSRLTDVDTGAERNIIDGLVVRFDHATDKLILIRRAEVFYKLKGTREHRSRRQFPIQPAFGATVHKVQGLTLQNICICMNNFFAPGQLFVAFSRVKTLEGLHLFDAFDIDKVKVDRQALMEVNRLRANAYDQDLQPHPLPPLEKSKQVSKEKKKTSGPAIICTVLPPPPPPLPQPTGPISSSTSQLPNGDKKGSGRETKRKNPPPRLVNISPPSKKHDDLPSPLLLTPSPIRERERRGGRQQQQQKKKLEVIQLNDDDDQEEEMIIDDTQSIIVDQIIQEQEVFPTPSPASIQLSSTTETENDDDNDRNIDSDGFRRPQPQFSEMTTMTQKTKKKRQGQVVTLEMRLPLPLRNTTGHECWVISAVNLLNQLVEPTQSLITMSNASLDPILSALVFALKGQSATVSRLQELLMAPCGLRRRNEDGSVVKAITTLLSLYPPDVMDQLNFESHTVLMCNKCSALPTQFNRPVRVLRREQEVLDLDMRGFYDVQRRRKVTLKEAVEEQTRIKTIPRRPRNDLKEQQQKKKRQQQQKRKLLLDDEDFDDDDDDIQVVIEEDDEEIKQLDEDVQLGCRHCDCDGEYVKKRQYQLPPNHRYLLMAPLWLQGDGTSHGNPTLLPHDYGNGDTLLNGQRYIFLGLVEHVKLGSRINHFRTWLRNTTTTNATRYLCVDDDKLSYVNNLPAGLYNRAVVLLFKKKEYLRDRKTGSSSKKIKKEAGIKTESSQTKVEVKYEQQEIGEEEKKSHLLLQPKVEEEEEKIKPTAPPLEEEMIQPEFMAATMMDVAVPRVEPTTGKLIFPAGYKPMLLRFEIEYCDLFEQIGCQAIVNAANDELQPGGGIDGEIRRRAGDRLNAELRNHRLMILNKQPNQVMQPGQAIVSNAYDLEKSSGYTKIIHVAAPDLRLRPQKKATNQDLYHLALCYRNACRAATSPHHQPPIVALSFPLLGANIFGWPRDLALMMAAYGVMMFMEEEHQKMQDLLAAGQIYENTLRKIYLANLPNYLTMQTVEQLFGNKRNWIIDLKAPRNGPNIRETISYTLYNGSTLLTSFIAELSSRQQTLGDRLRLLHYHHRPLDHLSSTSSSQFKLPEDQQQLIGQQKEIAATCPTTTTTTITAGSLAPPLQPPRGPIYLPILNPQPSSSSFSSFSSEKQLAKAIKTSDMDVAVPRVEPTTGKLIFPAGYKPMLLRFEIQYGDLFEQIGCQAIVNAANDELQPGKDIDGEIRRRAGAKLNAELRNHRLMILNKQSNQVMQPGQAIVSNAYDLEKSSGYTKIIHVAAPDLRLRPQKKATNQDLYHLALCYRNACRAATSPHHQPPIVALSFPLLGARIFGWPFDLALIMATYGVMMFMEEEHQKMQDLLAAGQIYENTLRRIYLANLPDYRIMQTVEQLFGNKKNWIIDLKAPRNGPNIRETISYTLYNGSTLLTSFIAELSSRQQTLGDRLRLLHYHYRPLDYLSSTSNQHQFKSEDQQRGILPSGILPDRGLRLKNGGSDCFLISAVNMLATVDWLFERLTSTPPSMSELEYHLGNLFARQTSSPSSLRSALQNAHRTTRLARGHQDAKEAMSLLNEAIHLPREEAVLMREIVTCQRCHTTVNLPKEPFWSTNLQLTKPYPMRLNEAVREAIEVPSMSYCPTCNAHLVDGATRYEVDSLGSYFWIAINMDNGGEGRRRRNDYRGLLDVDVIHATEMFGVYWWPVALVEYRPGTQTRWSDAGNYGQSGHYVTWLNNPHGVGSCCLDDDRYLGVNMPRGASIMNNIVLIMFKRE